MSHYALFDTAIGPMALAWGPHGVVACELPARSPAHLEARFARRHERAAPDGFAAEVIARLCSHLAGQPDALLDVALDLRATPAFAQRVYALTRAIAPGDTRTYGQIADTLGGAGLARAVGQALGANPFAPIVPCHRVMAAHGGAGGFSATGGVSTKLRLLEIEGARHGGQDGLF